MYRRNILFKVCLVLMCVLLLAGLCACGQSGQDAGVGETALAAEDTTAPPETEPRKKVTGDIHWTLDENSGLLTITGQGDMEDYYIISLDEERNRPPWYDSRESIRSVVVADGVMSIGDGAFTECKNLSDVTLPGSVDLIGAYAFDWCESLERLELPEGLKSIGEQAFVFCTSLADIKLPNSVTHIGPFAFQRCDSLQSITIPDGVRRLSSNLFMRCDVLERVTLGKNTSSFDEDVFAFDPIKEIIVPEENTALSARDGVVFDKEQKKLILYPSGRLGEEYTVPDGVTSIGALAFGYVNILSAVTLPESVRIIEETAFLEGRSLESVRALGSLEQIGSSAFQDCKKLSSVELAGGAESVGEAAFSGCEALKSVSLEHTKQIGKNAFHNCGLLASVTLSDGLTTLGSGAFSGCGSLTEATIPEGPLALEENCFADCGKLQSVTLPESLQAIGSGAFARCASLARMKLLNPYCTIANNAIPKGADGFTLTGYESSTAQDYAKRLGCAFESLGTAPSRIKRPDTPPPAQTGPQIGILLPEGGFYERDGERMRTQLTELGYQTELAFSDDDPYKQASQVADMIDRGVQLLIVCEIYVTAKDSPIIESNFALEEQIERANNKGIVVIGYLRALQGVEVSYCVSNSYEALGRLQGSFIEQQLNLAAGGGPYNIEFITEDFGFGESPALYSYDDGVKYVLQPYLNQGTLNCVSGQIDMYQSAIWNDGDEQKTLDRIRGHYDNLLSTYYSDKPLHAVVCFTDHLARGVAVALEDAYRNDIYPIFTGFGAELDSVWNVLDGKQAMTAYFDTRDLCDATVKMADDVMKGETPETNSESADWRLMKRIPTYLVEPRVLTKENIVQALVDAGLYTEEELTRR